MKKIPLLLLSVFLLLPVLVYLGNLAGVPASRAVIVHLRDFVGMSATKETTNPTKKIEIEKIIPSHAHIGLVEAWRDLGMNGLEDLLQIVATPEVNQAWQTHAKEFLKTPLYATAFFSSSWYFWQTQQDKLSLIAYYQPWTDILLLMQVAKIENNYKIIAIGMTEPHTNLLASSPNTLKQQLTDRLQQAEQTFQTIAQNPNTLSSMLSATLAKKAQDNLQQFVNDIRNKLVANNPDVPKNLRPAIFEWLDAVQAQQIKEIQDLPEANRDWLKQLKIIQLNKINADTWLLAAIDYHQAERVLIAQLQINDRKVRTIDVQIWDAAMLGNVQ